MCEARRQWSGNSSRAFSSAGTQVNSCVDSALFYSAQLSLITSESLKQHGSWNIPNTYWANKAPDCTFPHSHPTTACGTLMFGVKTNSLSVIPNWANRFQMLVFHHHSVQRHLSNSQLLLFWSDSVATNCPGVWENTTMTVRRCQKGGGLGGDWWSGNWGYWWEMWHARREVFNLVPFPHVLVIFWHCFGQGKQGRHKCMAPTITAVGWCKNKHPVRCVCVGRRPVWTGQLNVKCTITN